MRVGSLGGLEHEMADLRSHCVCGWMLRVCHPNVCWVVRGDIAAVPDVGAWTRFYDVWCVSVGASGAVCPSYCGLRGHEVWSRLLVQCVIVAVVLCARWAIHLCCARSTMSCVIGDVVWA